MGGVLGTAGGATRPHVDDAGRIERDGVALDWWVGAGDRWHVPAEERSTRSARLGPAPVYETTVPVPGGVVIRRVYAVHGAGEPVVVEVENASPHAVALAHVVSVAHDHALVECDERGVVVDGRLVLALDRAPLRAAAAAGRSVRDDVTSGAAGAGPFAAIGGSGVEAAVVFPVAHRTARRAALLDPAAAPAAAFALAAMPAAGDVQRGWARLLDRGTRTELPDPWQAGVDAARADLLLAAPSAPVAVALEDWGFDDEFDAVWARLRGRERRAARRRARFAHPADAARAARAGGDPARFLRAVRDVLVHDRGGVVDLLPAFPAEWLGADLAVHALPVRAGLVSFALRWHGARPALLWEVPQGATAHAPALDPGWHTAHAAGEALLAEPPAPLLAMGTPRAAPGPGPTATAAPPGSFT